MDPLRFTLHGSRRGLYSLGLCALVTSLVGCGAVYPEVATPVRPAPAGYTPSPAPPDELLYIEFGQARIPERTRDGRRWDAVGGAAPDAFAKLLVNDKELIVTPVHSNTLQPSWPDQQRANYWIERGSQIRVELWDKNPINNHPICLKKIHNLHSKATLGRIDIRCSSGARMSLIVEPARAQLGLGMHYELQGQGVRVTRVIQESAAARAGLARGTRILKIKGQAVVDLDEAEVRSLINANSRTGLELEVVHADGRAERVLLREGPMYPSSRERALN